MAESKLPTMAELIQRGDAAKKRALANIAESCRLDALFGHEPLPRKPTVYELWRLGSRIVK